MVARKGQVKNTINSILKCNWFFSKDGNPSVVRNSPHLRINTVIVWQNLRVGGSILGLAVLETLQGPWNRPSAERVKGSLIFPTNTIHWPMLGQCWASVVDDGPALTQHQVDVLCLLGCYIHKPLQSNCCCDLLLSKQILPSALQACTHDSKSLLSSKWIRRGKSPASTQHTRRSSEKSTDKPRFNVVCKQTWDVYLILIQCWASVIDMIFLLISVGLYQKW